MTLRATKKSTLDDNKWDENHKGSNRCISFVRSRIWIIWNTEGSCFCSAYLLFVFISWNSLAPVFCNLMQKIFQTTKGPRSLQFLIIMSHLYFYGFTLKDISNNKGILKLKDNAIFASTSTSLHLFLMGSIINDVTLLSLYDIKPFTQMTSNNSLPIVSKIPHFAAEPSQPGVSHNSPLSHISQPRHETPRP